MTYTVKLTSSAAAAAEIDRRCERLMADRGCDYREAYRITLKADPELAKAYGQPVAPAIPVTGRDEKEILEWLLRALEAGMEDALPGELGILAREAAGFKRLGLPIDEAIGRVMGLHPGLVTAAKVQIKNLRRNAPGSADQATELAQGKTPGEVAHRRAQVLADANPCLSYSAALHQVLDDDPVLKTNYARS